MKRSGQACTSTRLGLGLHDQVQAGVVAAHLRFVEVLDRAADRDLGLRVVLGRLRRGGLRGRCLGQHRGGGERAAEEGRNEESHDLHLQPERV